MIAMSQKTAYIGGMSWKDYLDSDERKELEDAERERKAAADRYNSVRRTLKSRCDARMRRDPDYQGQDGEID